MSRLPGEFLLTNIILFLLTKSLAPERFQFNFREVIFKLNLINGGWGNSYEIALRWMQLDLTDDTSRLVQVMAWCRQATSHYLSQCWPRSMSPNGVIRPQWVKGNKFKNMDFCHYLSQCWPRLMSPNGVTRPQWVKEISLQKWIFVVRKFEYPPHRNMSESDVHYVPFYLPTFSEPSPPFIPPALTS